MEWEKGETPPGPGHEQPQDRRAARRARAPRGPGRRRRAPLTAEGAAGRGPGRPPAHPAARPTPGPAARRRGPTCPTTRRRPTVDDVRGGLRRRRPGPRRRRSSGTGLRRAARTCSARRCPDRPPRPSAVLAPLYEDGGEAWVVLTRRAARLRSHSGEVSFPGGGQEPADADLRATALREAWEETALDPASVEIVGELDHLSTITSGSFIVPYVGRAARPAPSSSRAPARWTRSCTCRCPSCCCPRCSARSCGTSASMARPIVFFDLVGDTDLGRHRRRCSASCSAS